MARRCSAFSCFASRDRHALGVAFGGGPLAEPQTRRRAVGERRDVVRDVRQSLRERLDGGVDVAPAERGVAIRAERGRGRQRRVGHRRRKRGRERLLPPFFSNRYLRARLGALRRRLRRADARGELARASASSDARAAASRARARGVGGAPRRRLGEERRGGRNARVGVGRLRLLRLLFFFFPALVFGARVHRVPCVDADGAGARRRERKRHRRL